MAIELLDANFSATSTFTAVPSHSVAIPTSVPSGAILFVGVVIFTNTETISSIADDVNGTWSTGSGTSGPTNNGGGLERSWFAYRENSASGTITITVTFNTDVSGHMVVGYGTGALTSGALEEFDASPAVQTSSVTDHDSDALTADTADGAIIGVMTLNNTAAISSVGTNETDVTAHSGLVHFVYEPYSSTGSKALGTIVLGTARRSIFHVGLFKAASTAGATPPPPPMRFSRGRKNRKRRRAA